jgi:hypothetical protein
MTSTLQPNEPVRSNERGLCRSALFLQVLQSLIELPQGDESAILESISNHVAARGALRGNRPNCATK